jgi:hypothetical protein
MDAGLGIITGIGLKRNHLLMMTQVITMSKNVSTYFPGT